VRSVWLVAISSRCLLANLVSRCVLTDRNRHDREHLSLTGSIEQAPAQIDQPARWAGDLSGVGVRRTILKVVGAGGATAALCLALQVVRNKVLASWLGPAGMGYWFLVQSLGSTLTALCFLGLSSGLSTVTAFRWSAGDRRGVRRLVQGCTVAVLAASLIPLLLLGPFPRKMAGLCLGSPDAGPILFLILLMNPVVNVGFIYASVMQGLFLVRAQCILGFSTYVVATAFCIAGAAWWGANGVAVGWVLSGFSGTVFSFVVVNHSLREPRGMEDRARGNPGGHLRAFEETVRELLPYSASTMLSVWVTGVVTLASRSLLVNSAGLTDMGFYATVTGIAGTVLLLIQSALGMYAVPQTAAVSGDSNELWALLGSLGRLAAVLMHGPLLALILFGEWVLSLLFSPSFARAAPLLPYVAWATCFQMAGWLFVLANNARSSPGRSSVARVVEAVMTLGAFFLLVPPLGALGACLAYAIGSGTFLLTLLLLQPRQWWLGAVRGRRTVATWVLMMVSLLAATRHTSVNVVVCLLSLLTVLFVATSGPERRRVISAVAVRFGF